MLLKSVLGDSKRDSSDKEETDDEDVHKDFESVLWNMIVEKGVISKLSWFTNVVLKPNVDLN